MGRLPFLVLQAVFGLMFATALYAADIPRYDVKSYCAQVANSVGGSEQIRVACFDQEQASYNNLKSRWARIPARTQSYCDQVARAVGSSYMIFDSCVDQELQAGGVDQEFTY